MPEQKGHGCAAEFPGHLTQGQGPRREGEGHNGPASVPKGRQAVRPAVEFRKRHTERRAHRGAYGLAVERIHRGRSQQHPCGTEGRGVPEDAADVVRVGDAFQHDHGAWCQGNVAPPQRGSAFRRGQAPAVYVEAGGRVELAGRQDEGGNIRMGVEQVRRIRCGCWG